jgi:hypothetical protein
VNDETVKDETGAREDTAAPDAGRRKVLVVSVAAVVVLVVAGLVVYLLTSGDDPDDQAAKDRDVPTISDSPAPTTPGATSGATVAPPATATGATGATAPADVQSAETIAEQAASAISGADATTLAKLACDPSTAGTEDTFPADAKAEVVGEPKISGDTATVDLKLTIGNSEPTVVPMPLVKQGGRWCVP